MTDEILTAEDRSHAGEYPGLLVSKILRLYDAALAHSAALVEMNATCIRDRDAALDRATAPDATGKELSASAWRTECTERGKELVELLARAEAAEGTLRVAAEDGADHQKRAYAAESRLAAAEALLRRCDALWETSGESEPRQGLHNAVMAFLSAAPAQAAEPAPVPLPLQCPACKLQHIDTLDVVTGIDWATRPHKTHLCLGCGVLFKPYEYPTVGVEHPDTIALRECRAELARRTGQAQSAEFRLSGAVKDTEQCSKKNGLLRLDIVSLKTDLESARADLATARGSVVELTARLAVAQDATVSAQRAATARIAELEAQECNAGKLAVAHLEAKLALQARIAQAVTELERGMDLDWCTTTYESCRSALAALKGET